MKAPCAVLIKSRSTVYELLFGPIEVFSVYLLVATLDQLGQAIVVRVMTA